MRSTCRWLRILGAWGLVPQEHMDEEPHPIPGRLRPCPARTKRPRPPTRSHQPRSVPAPAKPPPSRSDTCEARAAGERKRVLVRPQVAHIPVPVAIMLVGPYRSPWGWGKGCYGSNCVPPPPIHIRVLQPSAGLPWSWDHCGVESQGASGDRHSPGKDAGKMERRLGGPGPRRTEGLQRSVVLRGRSLSCCEMHVSFEPRLRPWRQKSPKPAAAARHPGRCLPFHPVSESCSR